MTPSRTKAQLPVPTLVPRTTCCVPPGQVMVLLPVPKSTELMVATYSGACGSSSRKARYRLVVGVLMVQAACRWRSRVTDWRRLG